MTDMEVYETDLKGKYTVYVSCNKAFLLYVVIEHKRKQATAFTSEEEMKQYVRGIV